MWAKLIVSVTLLPMLIHSILGCCWHHAHSECDFPGVRETVESDTGHCHTACHQHAGSHRCDHNDPAMPTPCEHKTPCDDVRCVYVATEPVRIALALDLQEHVAAIEVGRILTFAVAAKSLVHRHQTQRVSAALQHCALTQVWVV